MAVIRSLNDSLDGVVFRLEMPVLAERPHDTGCISKVIHRVRVEKLLVLVVRDLDLESPMCRIRQRSVQRDLSPFSR